VTFAGSIGALMGLVGMTAAVACTARLARPVYVAQPTSALTATPYPPPPARAEAVPPRPKGDATKDEVVWIDGEWVWSRRRWGWKSGRWVVAPSGCAFSPWTSTRAPDGTFYVAPGVWRDARGEVAAEPAPLATGRPTSGIVFDAEGDVGRAASAGGARRGRGDGGT
jgi:hypothetical protein